MNALEQGSARAQIANVVAIYNNCGDRGRVDEMLEAFTPDAVYDLPGSQYRGADEISAFLSGIVANGAKPPQEGAATTSLAGARHHLTTNRIEFLSDVEADSWTYFFTMARGVVFQEGLYIDRLTHTQSGWRISHRRVKILWDGNSQPR